MASTTLTKGNEEEFLTLDSIADFTLISQTAVPIKMWDMFIDQLYSDSWCTTYTPAFSGTITAGYT